jgi:hypothetical protein
VEILRVTSIKTALGEATREIQTTIPLSEIKLITTEKSVMTLIMPGLQANRGPMAEHLLLGETFVTPGESVMS